MNVKLVMFKQDGQRRDFELKRDSATLGRSNECDFQIPLPMVSRRHSQIFSKGGKLLVRDLGSSNGTFVNNKRVQESELNPGDTLVVGPVIFTIVIDGEPSDIQPVRTIVEGGAAAAAAPATQKSTAGTVDVASSAELDALDEVEEVEEVVEHHEADDEEEEETPAGSDALSALADLSKKKKT